jgi:hypothetical protein
MFRGSLCVARISSSQRFLHVQLGPQSVFMPSIIRMYYNWPLTSRVTFVPTKDYNYRRRSITRAKYVKLSAYYNGVQILWTPTVASPYE